MKKRVDKSEIDKANQVDLVAYAESKGESFVNQGQYHRHNKHDSLLITGNKWFWNSQQVGGYGAISFAKEFYDMSFPEAVQDINSMNIEKKNEITKSEYRKENFKYPKEYESKSTDNIKKYLVDERMLSPKVVDWLIEKDLIAEDRLKNVVFKWRENGGKGDIVGSDRQGTIPMDNGKYFKQVVANSDEKSGFQIDIGKPKQLIVCESPIDMLSYWQLKIKELKDVRLLSMSGLKDMTFLHSVTSLQRQGFDVEKVIMAVDNDEAGRNFIKKANDSYTFKEGTFVTDTPINKDWNEDLQKKHKRENVIRNEMSM